MPPPLLDEALGFQRCRSAGDGAFDDGGFADASNDRRRPLPVATAYGDVMTRESFLFDPGLLRRGATSCARRLMSESGLGVPGFP